MLSYKTSANSPIFRVSYQGTVEYHPPRSMKSGMNVFHLSHYHHPVQPDSAPNAHICLSIDQEVVNKQHDSFFGCHMPPSSMAGPLHPTACHHAWTPDNHGSLPQGYSETEMSIYATSQNVVRNSERRRSTCSDSAALAGFEYPGVSEINKVLTEPLLGCMPSEIPSRVTKCTAYMRTSGRQEKDPKEEIKIDPSLLTEHEKMNIVMAKDAEDEGRFFASDTSHVTSSLDSDEHDRKYISSVLETLSQHGLEPMSLLTTILESTNPSTPLYAETVDAFKSEDAQNIRDLLNLIISRPEGKAMVKTWLKSPNGLFLPK